MIKGGSFLCADNYCQRLGPAARRPQMIGTLMSHIGIRTGSGTEFVRAISQDFYGISPEGVVGTLVIYPFARDAAGRPHLVREAALDAGAATAGDRKMLEYALAADGPSSALLVDHDDPDSHGQSPLRAFWACSNRDATTAPRRIRGIDVTPS